MGRVLPPFEVHRPNTTALDRKQSCFLSPGPQGTQLGGGSVSNTGAVSGSQRLGTNLRTYVRSLSPFLCPLGGSGHPSLNTSPSGHTPSSLLPAHQPGFFHNKVRHSTPSPDCTTHQPKEENSHSCPGAWATGQRQENSSTNRPLTPAAGPALQPYCLENGSPHLGRTAGQPACGRGRDSVTPKPSNPEQRCLGPNA